MRVKEKIERAGFFWLPNSPKNQIPGNLTITDGGEIKLEVVGLFEEEDRTFDKVWNFKRIIGHVEKDGLVTLDDCSYINKPMPFGQIVRSRLRVGKMFSGVAYDENEEVAFNRLRISIEGLDDWVNISGIKVDYHHGEERTATINYDPPDDIALKLTNGMRLEITFAYTMPGMPHAKEAKITQKTYFELVSVEKRNFQEFVTVAHRLTTFLCFATDKIVCLDQVKAFADDLSRQLGDGRRMSVPVLVFYESLPFAKHPPKIEWHDMLFRFLMIRENAEAIINKWIDAHEQIDVAFGLYFSARTDAHKYLDGRFLALAQGLETYHRRTSIKTLMDAAAYKELVSAIVQGCPSHHREWLNGRLMYGNEISLRKRLDDVVEPFKELVGTDAQCRKLIDCIVATRNYQTHFDKSQKKKAADGLDLWKLCCKMEVLFQLQFLSVLGFSTDEIKHIFEEGGQLKRKFQADD